jgi:uncharacterized protein (UPF0261 family)
VPGKFKNRTLYKHNPTVTLMRTTPDECREIGRRIAGKLNGSKAPVILLLPLRGVSAIDREGQPFHHPEADRALFESLKTHVNSSVQVIELDQHINDPEFADVAAGTLLKVLNECALKNYT